MARLHLTLLGGFQLRVDQRTIPVTTKKAQALLAYLALRPDRPHSRDTLVGLLWGDASEERARHNLRQTMFRLRQAFARARNAGLVARGDTIALDTAAVSVDALEFQRLLGGGTAPGLEAALALYQGALLEGMHVAEPSFEEWLQPERERFRDSAVQALAQLLGHQTKRGAVDAAVQTATRLLALDPLQEGIHRALMRLYAQRGRRASALRQYQVCVGVLQRELGVEPEPETRRAYQEILQQKDRPIVTPEPPVAARPGPRRVAPHVARAVPSLEPPVVGRQVELAGLHQALDEAWRGGGRTAVVLGEAGIGKTRLLEELATSALQRGGRLLSSRCYETEQILPFGPWVQALRAGLEGLGRDVLEGLDPISRADVARLLPELAEPDQGPSGSADDYLRLFGAVARVIEVLAALSPLVLTLEDLHWADEMSVRLFGFLARRVEAWPCLLVASARVEDLGQTPLLRPLLAELREQRHAVNLILAPLSKAETHRLVAVLGRAGTEATVLERVAEQVWTLSEGNPFVAVETMRALDEGHRFDAGGIGLPGRVREAIGSRLERLSPRARALLAVAAVIGREFEFKLLHHAARLEEGEVAEGIEELVRRGVLHGVGARLDFAHDRIREVAYDHVFASRRTQLHASVGQAIEAVYAGELEPHHGALGAHFRRGEAWEKALRYLRQAGSSAAACAAYREALAYLEQALEVVEHLPEGRSRTEQAHDLGMHRAAVTYYLGELRRIVGRLDEAAAIARALDDPLRLGRVDSLRLSCLAAMGEQTVAIESGERSLAVAEAAGNLPLRATVTLMLGFAHIGLGDFRRATAYLRMTAATVQDQSPHKRFGLVASPAVLWRAWIMLPLGELGAFPEAFALGEEASRIAAEIAQPYSHAVIGGALGHLHCVRGTPALGIPALERLVALCRDYDIAVLSPLPFASLGHAYAMSGRLSEALPLLEEAIAQGESLHVMWWQSRRMVQLAEGYLLAGRADEARAAVERALSLAEAHGERGNRAHALRALAEMILRRDRPDLAEAERHLGQALDLAEELAMRPLAARCQLDLGRLYRRAGDESRARVLLTEAGERLREMDMRLWLDQVNAELASAAPPR
jgi:DNA-binding SARP family transcriptional activator/DNA-binding Lrp family transcriptional regulator